MFFTKPIAQIETVPRLNPKLAEIELAHRAYQDAEARWTCAKEAVRQYRIAHPRPDSIWTANDAAFLHVNVLKNEDPQLTRLCGIERAAARARNEALRGWLRAQGKLTV